MTCLYNTSNIVWMKKHPEKVRFNKWKLKINFSMPNQRILPNF